MWCRLRSENLRSKSLCPSGACSENMTSWLSGNANVFSELPRKRKSVSFWRLPALSAAGSKPCAASRCQLPRQQPLPNASDAEAAASKSEAASEAEVLVLLALAGLITGRLRTGRRLTIALPRQQPPQKPPPKPLQKRKSLSFWRLPALSAALESALRFCSRAFLATMSEKSSRCGAASARAADMRSYQVQSQHISSANTSEVRRIMSTGQGPGGEIEMLLLQQHLATLVLRVMLG